jgi:two-component system KDP operon response regulator KdpE
MTMSATMATTTDKSRVLVVDDEPQMLRSLRLILTGHGYDVVAAASGEAALEEVARRMPDVMLLDLMLPGVDGLEVCRRVRARSAVPIIVLSARGEEAVKVQALDLGADDYLTKPFGADELLARVRVALRHAAGPTNALVFESGSLHIDFNRRRVTLGDRDIALTPKEFDVLKYLVTNADRVLTHSLILRAVWGPEYGSETQYLRNVIRDLRRKLHDDPAHPAFIVTEPGVGYRFQTE